MPNLSGLEEIDKDLTSLPDEVREDVMKELEENLDKKANFLEGRPVNLKLETVREWEELKETHGKPNWKIWT